MKSIAYPTCYTWFILGFCSTILFAGKLPGTGELLKNPAFKKGFSNWSFYIHKDLQKTVQYHLNNSILTLQMAKSSGPGNVQLMQKITLKEGHQYQFSFDAMRQGVRAKTLIQCSQIVKPYANVGLSQSVYFSKTWSRHEMVFTARGLTTGKPSMIRLFLGSQTGSVQLRNFSLMEYLGNKMSASKKQKATIRIVPQPKIFTLKRGVFQLGKTLFIRSNQPAATGLFKREVRFITGDKQPNFKVSKFKSEQPFFSIGNTAKTDLFDEVDAPPPFEGGYTLVIVSRGIAIKGFDREGLRNGIQSLLEVLEQSSGGALPRLAIRDLPDLKFRAMHVVLRPPAKELNLSDDKMLDFYRWSFRRMGRYKYTHVCLMIRGTLKLKKHPEVWPHATFSHEQIKKIIQIANDQGLIVFPELKTLGKFFPAEPQFALDAHADMLERKIPTTYPNWREILREGLAAARLKKKQNKTNTSNEVAFGFNIESPKVLPLIRDCIDEIYELFNHPKLFHLGMDEAFYFGASWPKDTNRGRRFADYANTLNRYLKAKGCRTMIWSDMLLSHVQFPYFFEHHGGPPKNTYKALPLLDKDIILADWHYGFSVLGEKPKHYPMTSWLRQHGFDVISVPWFDQDNMVNIARDNGATDGMGLMGSSWAMYMTYYIHTRKEPLPKSWKFWNRKKVQNLKELGIFASTAEAAWSLLESKENIKQYDSVKWEKRWLRQSRSK